MNMDESEVQKLADTPDARRLPPEVVQEIVRAVARIDYGSVEIVVHDGRVVQIECREKIRIDRDEPGRKGAVRQMR
jgi:hypothetical protein